MVLNLTGISTASGAFITAYPSDTARPPTSNLNLIAGQTAAVLVVASLSDDGQVTLYNSGGPTHLILDVEGWFTSTNDYIPVTPTRLVDTRGPDTVPYGQDTEIPGAALGNAPPGSGAAVLSVTAVNPSASGYVTVHAGGTAVPTTSSLNTSSSGTVANLVVTQLSPTGSFAIFDRAPGADILVDVVGWLHTNRALSFPAPGIGPGEVGQPYDATLGQAGGLAPYTWVTASGALPDGLTLSATDGSVSGTPTSDGPDVATIRIRDSSGQSVQRTLNFKTYPFVSSTLWGWGWDGFNQLPPQTQDSSVPQQLSAQSGVKDVSVSYSEGLAVHQDGTLWTWGGNQLVDNGPTGGIPASAPVQITGLTGRRLGGPGQQHELCPPVRRDRVGLGRRDVRGPRQRAERGQRRPGAGQWAHRCHRDHRRDAERIRPQVRRHGLGLGREPAYGPRQRRCDIEHGAASGHRRQRGQRYCGRPVQRVRRSVGRHRLGLG